MSVFVQFQTGSLLGDDPLAWTRAGLISYWPWGWSPDSSLANQKLPWDFLASLPGEDTDSQPGLSGCGNVNLGMSVSVFLLLGMCPHKAEVNQGKQC